MLLLYRCYIGVVDLMLRVRNIQRLEAVVKRGLQNEATVRKVNQHESFVLVDRKQGMLKVGQVYV